MEFHRYIKEYRTKYFKDMGKFAKILGIGKVMWRKIERGINPPPRRSLLRRFAFLTHMKGYEEQQMYALARRWKPSPDTNSANHTLLSESSRVEWREALIAENTPDYPHKYWKA